MVAKYDTLNSFGSFDIVGNDGRFNTDLASSVKDAGFGVKQQLSQNFDVQSGIRANAPTPAPLAPVLPAPDMSMGMSRG